MLLERTYKQTRGQLSRVLFALLYSSFSGRIIATSEKYFINMYKKLSNIVFM